MTAIQAVELTLAAVAVGALLPVLMQLFSTLRTVQKAAERIDSRLEALLETVSRPTASVETGARIASALTTAVMAGVTAYRATRATAEDEAVQAAGAVEGAQPPR